MNLESFKKYLFFPLLLVAGLILRILLSPYWTYEGDFGTWKWWAGGVSQVGFSEFYDKHWCDYMPGYIYVLWLLDHIHSAFPRLPDKILFKLPANLSDLGIAILIFFVLRKITSIKNAKIASLVYFFNPASLSNSTFWGQVDSVHTLPLLLSVALGLRGDFFASGVSASLAFMIKPQSIVIFPIIGFLTIRHILMREKGHRMDLKALIPSVKMLSALIVTSFIVTLPFISGELDTIGGIFKEPIHFIEERFDRAYTQYSYASLNAFNFWGVVAMWQSDQTRFFGITYQSWGTIIFGIFYALIFGLLFRSEIIRGIDVGAQNAGSGRAFQQSSNFEPLLLQKQNTLGPADNALLTIRIIHAVTLILFALFLFVTRVHERHFLPTIAFFTIIAFRSWIYWFFYGLVSLVYVVNMTYAYAWLTSRWFSPSLIEPFIPGFILVLLVVFLIVLVDFIRSSIGLYKGASS